MSGSIYRAAMFLCLRDGKSFSGGVHTAESLAGTAAALQRGARSRNFILKTILGELSANRKLRSDRVANFRVARHSGQTTNHLGYQLIGTLARACACLSI